LAPAAPVLVRSRLLAGFGFTSILVGVVGSVWNLVVGVPALLLILLLGLCGGFDSQAPTLTSSVTPITAPPPTGPNTDVAHAKGLTPAEREIALAALSRAQPLTGERRRVMSQVLNVAGGEMFAASGARFTPRILDAEIKALPPFSFYTQDDRRNKATYRTAVGTISVSGDVCVGFRPNMPATWVASSTSGGFVAPKPGTSQPPLNSIDGFPSPQKPGAILVVLQGADGSRLELSDGVMTPPPPPPPEHRHLLTRVGQFRIQALGTVTHLALTGHFSISLIVAGLGLLRGKPVAVRRHLRYACVMGPAAIVAALFTWPHANMAFLKLMQVNASLGQLDLLWTPVALFYPPLVAWVMLRSRAARALRAADNGSRRAIVYRPEPIVARAA
jgi:hypothetical protein